jgi:hypothetical protein
LLLFVSTYLIPLGCMGACYARMGSNLWGSEVVGEETPALIKSRQSKQKVNITFALLSKVPTKFREIFTKFCAMLTRRNFAKYL